MDIQQRTELVVTVYSLKQARKLKRYGDVRFVSQHMHYVILFVNSDNLEQTIADLKKLNFVKKVDVAPTPTLLEEFLTMNEETDEEV